MRGTSVMCSRLVRLYFEWVYPLLYAPSFVLIRHARATTCLRTCICMCTAQVLDRCCNSFAPGPNCVYSFYPDPPKASVQATRGFAPILSYSYSAHSLSPRLAFTCVLWCHFGFYFSFPLRIAFSVHGCTALFPWNQHDDFAHLNLWKHWLEVPPPSFPHYMNQP